MVRSMFSGVAGMKAHQVKMDTIGNNISNVNTFGFKSSRVTFRDVYYQSMRSGSGGTSNRGGTNPSQVGYGAVLGSIDVNHGTSSMQNTGNPLDIAISGEGFFQVQDIDGNTFYTKAGMLDVDSAGNLVDVNGNFVLGVSGNPLGKPASENRIQIAVPPVVAATASCKTPINGVSFNISSQNQTTDANAVLTFAEGSDLAVGEDIKALITSTGINIRVNPKATFATQEAFSAAINKAITNANGGKPHPAGDFTIMTEPASAFPAGGLSGAEITGANFGVKKGSIPVPAAWKDIISVDSVGDGFSGGSTTATDFSKYQIKKELDASNPADPLKDKYTFTVKCGPKTYTGELTGEQMASNTKLLLKQNPDVSGDTITINVPTAKAVDGKFKFTAGVAGDTTEIETATPSTSSTKSKDLGLGGAPFKLKGGTAGGPQTVEDLTGIAIGSDGVIIGNHAVHGMMELGRIDIANFGNPKGLEQTGSTYFAASANSGDPKICKSGEDGTGSLASGSLEMSSVDLSNEFADMITTQRGFQANSRMITVSDTMLEELINLKR